MAKKSKSSKKRKQRKPNVPVYQVPTESEDSEQAPAKPVAATVATGQSPLSNPIASKDATTETIDWAKEYPFFAPDMKKLGIVVALMVALLLALNVLFIYVL
jgi:hypothetical protein